MKKKHNFQIFDFNTLVILLLFVISGCNNNPNNQKLKVEKGFIDLTTWDFEKQGNIDLSGTWEFYNNATLYSSDFLNTDSLLTPVYMKVPSAWESFKNETSTVFGNGQATYRLKIKLKPGKTNYGLQINEISSAFKLYVNGNLLEQAGNVSDSRKTEVASSKSSYSFIGSENLSDTVYSDNTIEIILQISNFQSYSSGIIQKIYFGKYNNIEHYYNSRLNITYLILGILLIIVIYHLILYFLRKEDISYLFFAIMCLSMIFRILTTNERLLILWFPDINYQITSKIEYITGYGVPLFFAMFFYFLFKAKEHRKIILAIIYIGLSISLFIIVTPTWIFRKFDLILNSYALLSGTYIVFVYILVLYIKKYEYSNIAFWGMIIFYLGGLNDVLKAMMALDTPLILPYAMVFYILSQAYLLSKRSANALKSVEFLSSELKFKNENLQFLVEERTKEIENQKEEILSQKEELLVTNEELHTLNQELEKLSLVARETDNAVSIFNKDGQIIWVNEGFVRLYGYTLDEFILEKGSTLNAISNSSNVSEIFENCIKNKKSVTYQSKINTKDKKTVWTQITLNPILDEKDSVKMIIAIESNITKVKETELKIKIQNEEIFAQKEQLEYVLKLVNAKNENINASLRYAKTIQNAILPSTEAISKYFEFFIVYKPKDIVSGDFYWLSNVSLDNNSEYIFFAVADCTGHGVPGAFMSMIGSRLLNEIVNERQIYEPSEVLNNLEKLITITLRQKETENKDGMDICLISILRTEENNELTFSGAKRPMYYYNKNELSIIEPDKRSIGGTNIKNNLNFTSKKIILNTSETIYLSSDGYIDQPDSNRKRLGTPLFLSKLREIADLDLQTQAQELDKFYFEYSNSTEQRDDITVIGLRIKAL